MDGTGGGSLLRGCTAAATASQLSTSMWMPWGGLRSSGASALMRSNARVVSGVWTTVTPRTSVRTGVEVCSSPPCRARKSPTRASPAQCSGPIPAPMQNASARSSSSTDGSPTRFATHRWSAAKTVMVSGGVDCTAPGVWTMSHSTGRPFSECGVSRWLIRSGTR